MHCLKCHSHKVELLRVDDPGDFDDEYKKISKTFKCENCGEEFTIVKTVCAHIED